MDLELQGKRVLITGGSKGIGLAVAQRFLAEGAKVIIVSRSEQNLALARLQLNVGDERLRTLVADLRDARQAELVVDTAAAQWGELDILVNSAGDAKRRLPEELDSAAWHAALDAKYFTYIHTQDAVLARWRNSQTQGAIVNVVGTGGRVPNPSHAAGGAANAALLLSTIALAQHYAKRGIRINAVNPGFTLTERMSGSIENEAKRLNLTPEQALTRMEEEQPLGRFGRPEEIADVVLFLSSARASYVVGAIVAVDGGQKAIL